MFIFYNALDLFVNWVVSIFGISYRFPFCERRNFVEKAINLDIDS